ncbi:MAG: TetR/AcrR family transcriptional regulator [Acidobacteriales bacterium]|nr:TetR/AcrR family transcriptional regulator [Terriglobales bacterium]
MPPATPLHPLSPPEAPHPTHRVTASATTADQIQSAALALLEDHGSQAVTMRKVAQAVGITPMAIYHYFPNRESLLRAVTDAEFAHLRDLIESRLNQPTAQPLLLLDLMDAYIDYAFLRPRIFDYVFSIPRPDARTFPDDFRAGKSPTLTPVADAVAGAMLQGAIRSDDPWEIALELWALVHGYIVLYRAARFHLSEPDFRQLCRRALMRLLDGLKP